MLMNMILRWFRLVGLHYYDLDIVLLSSFKLITMSLQLLQNRSTLQPKKGHQRDPYIGPLHHQTKKRHGKGNYLYPNKFFQYQGEYVHGKKHGLGVLRLKDGTTIQAYFDQDQIQGQGKISYPDASFYHGALSLGQRNGHGLYQSQFEKYEGQWKSNSKQGQGRHEILSRGQVYQGTFQNNKLQGQGSLKSYNYEYFGEWNQGKKQGHGSETNLWRRMDDENPQSEVKYDKFKNYDSYHYQGSFANDMFHGQGKYSSKICNYTYDGEFCEGLPKSYPNQLRVFVSSNVKNQNGEEKQSDKTLLDQSSPLEYQLQTDSKNLYIQCVYEGPEYLDPNQPSEEEIDQMIKNWQNQNKKNKNPPPMPDFKAPKMIKPQLVLISQQNSRPFLITLQSNPLSDSGQAETNDQRMKLDYRQQIALKRTQFEKIKEQQKKTEDEDPKKKGGKKQAKNEAQFKINLFKQIPSQKQKSIKLQTNNGICSLMNFELPDDFPQGKYSLRIKSNFSDFGNVKQRKIEFIVKGKQAGTKKK